MNSGFADVEALEERLSRPDDDVVADMARLEGDIMILGVGGKMGPTLARMARRAAPNKRIIARRPLFRAGAAGACSTRRHRDAGVRSARPGRRGRPSRCRNVVFMAGLKFGAAGDPGLTWAMNVHMPALVAERFRAARSRVLDRLRLSVRAGRPEWSHRGRGARSARRIRDELPRPRADYSNISGTSRNPGPAVPANYAIELRYGVLNDIARKVRDGAPIDLTMGTST